MRCPKPARVIRNRSRRARARAFLAAFAVLLVLGGSAAGGLWYFGIKAASADSAPLADENVRPFEIHGIELGMTAEAVRERHPRITVHWRNGGGHVGEFVASGVAHTVWFKPGWKPGSVYRISYRQIFPLMSPEGVQDQFAWQFGAPISAECESPPAERGMVLCTYKWMTRKGVAVEVRSRDLAGPTGDPLTVLTVTATDVGTAKDLATQHKGAGQG